MAKTVENPIKQIARQDRATVETDLSGLAAVKQEGREFIEKGSLPLFAKVPAIPPCLAFGRNAINSKEDGSDAVSEPSSLLFERADQCRILIR